MGAVAAALQRRGDSVSGSDANVYPPMSSFLEAEGIAVTEGFQAENIPAETDVVVVGNAISRGNEEAETVLERKLLYLSLPEVLKQEFLRGRRNLVVTGTHGKTTTASLLAWLLECSGRNPGFLIGGIPRNFHGGARFEDSEWVVLEGDEYDCAFFDKRSKFLHYLPEVVVVNNIEYDHADIFGSVEEITLSFRRLLNIVPRNGMIFVNGDDPVCLEAAAGAPAPVRRVGLSPDCEARIEGLELDAEEVRFRIGGEDYKVPMGGMFNARNAAMSICAARHVGLSPEAIRAGFPGFLGIARRQELRGERRGVRVIDDFGHHPTAIRETLVAMRRRYPQGKLWAVFEPRSNSSQRRVFQEQFTAAFREADAVVLTGLHRPERIAEEERLDVARVVADLSAAGRQAWVEAGADAIVCRLAPLVESGDTIVVFSNGGFDGIHGKLLNRL